MDSEWNAALRALTSLNRDASYARLALAAGETPERAAKIMRGEVKQD